MAQKKGIKKWRLILMIIILTFFIWGSLWTMLRLVFAPTPEQQLQRQRQKELQQSQMSDKEKEINLEEELQEAIIKNKSEDKQIIDTTTGSNILIEKKELITDKATNTGNEILIKNETTTWDIIVIPSIEEENNQGNANSIIEWKEKTENIEQKNKWEEGTWEEELWNLLQWLLK